MPLPLKPSYSPMEAISVASLAEGNEPKWDGLRCLAFKDGDQIELQSNPGKLLTGYFPEIVDAL